MTPATPLSEAPRLPATTGTGLLAIVVTLLSWSGSEIDAIDMTYRAWEGQPWRLLTSALPHVGLLHLVFNLYWLWRLGTRIEERYGSLKTFALYVFLAAGSAAAEHAFFRGGVGLSGVGYGIVGFLAVAHRYESRLRDAIDDRTLSLFGGWFVLCIAATVTDIFPVANVAHGAGFVLGAVAGFAATAPSAKRRAIGTVAAVLTTALCLAGSAIFRPYLNIGAEGGVPAWADAEAAFIREDYEESERLYEYALSVDPQDARLWFNLGCTRQAMERYPEAIEAFERAVALDPDETSYREALTMLLMFSQGRAPQIAE